MSRAPTGPEAIFEITDPRAHLTGFIVVDSTRLGPAFGGVRIRPYAEEREALLEALALGAAMSLKAALAGLRCGGGKIVIIDRPGLRRGRAIEAVAEALNDLGGKFFAGRDFGMGRADLVRLRRSTRFAADESAAGMGDLSDATARGTLVAVRAALRFSGEGFGTDREHAAAPRSRADRHGVEPVGRGLEPRAGRHGVEPAGRGLEPRAGRHGVVSAGRGAQLRPGRHAVEPTGNRTDGPFARATTMKGNFDRDLVGLRVAVQGLGSVGGAIVRRLLEAGAEVVAADIDPAASRRAAALGVRIVSPSALSRASVEVFIPAAGGGTLDKALAARCRARVVCGPENCALSNPDVERTLVERGIVYVPDALASAGALIAGVLHHLEKRTDISLAVGRIGFRVTRLLRESARSGLLPTEIARRTALRRLARGR